MNSNSYCYKLDSGKKQLLIPCFLFHYNLVAMNTGKAGA